MKPQYVGGAGRKMPMRDVAKSHTDNLRNMQCLSLSRQAIVSEGRTQATYTSHLGRAPGQSDKPIPQETRSRGCPRAQRQFSPFALLPFWQRAAAQKKPKPSILKTQLFRPSRLTPANTNKTSGRACGASCAMPALFLSRTKALGGAA